MFTKLRILLVGASLALVTGCAGFSLENISGAVPSQAIFAIKSSYATALKAAVTYKELAPCSDTVVVKVTCSDPKVVAQIQKADTLAFAAIRTAQAAVDTVGGPSALAAIDAAQAAITALTVVLSH